jgi:uroporphyrinogen decarboxylase
LPIDFWRHFTVADQDPQLLAKIILDFQAQFDFDLIKITPASSYCVSDWGVEDIWKGNPEGTRDYTRRVIQKPEDWLSLKVLEPITGHLGQSLEAVKLILTHRKAATPVLQTVFNPLSQAKNLAGPDVLLNHLRSHPELVLEGLKTITLSIQQYLAELIRSGVDGIFYAIQHAQSHLLTKSEFEQFSQPFDQAILAGASDLWLNMVHIHGQNILFDGVSSYPSVHMINWHDRETDIPLSAGLDKFAGIACGGLSRDSVMLLGTPRDVENEIRDGFEQTGGSRWMVGTGCVMMTTTPTVNIWAALEASRKYRGR